eukprot:gnl/MRDRNA2_/MRDRNA2_98711_c0_seq1.p1 gnl/MRDRNA2_/MRDRNA2_98711_c0~~gnl/MRDRNA2_/MRDRNA2_98711_c0_seq1.p1  ORF type:complete len:981 (+),score=215.70 gnl/MRDRNA2_/MRDRNA2_98711_c0_seq1:112-3054(+)
MAEVALSQAATRIQSLWRGNQERQVLSASGIDMEKLKGMQVRNVAMIRAIYRNVREDLEVQRRATGKRLSETVGAEDENMPDGARKSRGSKAGMLKLVANHVRKGTRKALMEKALVDAVNEKRTVGNLRELISSLILSEDATDDKEIFNDMHDMLNNVQSDLNSVNADAKEAKDGGTYNSLQSVLLEMMQSVARIRRSRELLDQHHEQVQLGEDLVNSLIQAKQSISEYKDAFLSFQATLANLYVSEKAVQETSEKSVQEDVPLTVLKSITDKLDSVDCTLTIEEEVTDLEEAYSKEIEEETAKREEQERIEREERQKRIEEQMRLDALQRAEEERLKAEEAALQAEQERLRKEQEEEKARAEQLRKEEQAAKELLEKERNAQKVLEMEQAGDVMRLAKHPCPKCVRAGKTLSSNFSKQSTNSRRSAASLLLMDISKDLGSLRASKESSDRSTSESRFRSSEGAIGSPRGTLSPCTSLSPQSVAGAIGSISLRRVSKGAPSQSRRASESKENVGPKENAVSGEATEKPKRTLVQADVEDLLPPPSPEVDDLHSPPKSPGPKMSLGAELNQRITATMESVLPSRRSSRFKSLGEEINEKIAASLPSLPAVKDGERKVEEVCPICGCTMDAEDDADLRELDWEDALQDVENFEPIFEQRRLSRRSSHESNPKQSEEAEPVLASQPPEPAPPSPPMSEFSRELSPQPTESTRRGSGLSQNLSPPRRGSGARSSSKRRSSGALEQDQIEAKVAHQSMQSMMAAPSGWYEDPETANSSRSRFPWRGSYHEQSPALLAIASQPMPTEDPPLPQRVNRHSKLRREVFGRLYDTSGRPATFRELCQHKRGEDLEKLSPRCPSVPRKQVTTAVAPKFLTPRRQRPRVLPALSPRPELASGKDEDGDQDVPVSRLYVVYTPTNTFAHRLHENQTSAAFSQEDDVHAASSYDGPSSAHGVIPTVRQRTRRADGKKKHLDVHVCAWDADLYM